MSLKLILQNAKDSLTPENWGKGSKLFEREKKCAAIAINEAAGGHYDIAMETQKALAQAIKPGSNEFACGDIIINFNDDPATTLEDVRAKFDTAIAAAPEE